MLKKRIISGIVLALFVIGILFLTKPWFYLIFTVATFWGILELWTTNIGRHQTRLDFCLYFFPPVFYVIFSLLWVAGELRWKSNIWWFISAIAATSTYDTLAYFIGKSIGKHKIVPKISPNKSWEGTVAGFLGPVLVTLITGKYFLFLGWLEIGIFALMIGFLAFFGDLSVSWYKRKLGVKDIGYIIPGHGGLLDRIDSHLLVFLGVFCFQAII